MPGETVKSKQNKPCAFDGAGLTYFKLFRVVLLGEGDHFTVGFFAQVVLDFAGVLGGGVGVDAQSDKERGKLTMADVDAVVDLHTGSFQH